MTYVPTTWVEKVTKVGPANLNKLEQGLAAVANGVISAPITLASGFAAKSGLGPAVGFDLEGSGSGTSSDTESTFFYRKITSDTISQGTGSTWVFGELLEHHFGGAAAEGGRAAMQAGLFFDGGATNASNPNRNYVAVQGQFVGSSNDGGSGGSYKGAGFGFGSTAQLKAAATYFLNLTAGEFDVLADAGMHCNYISGIQVSGNLQSNGDTYDAGVALSGTGSHIGFKTGFLIGAMNGTAPLATTSTLMQVINQPTLSKGFDFSTTAFSTFVLNANGFEIAAPAGNHSIEIGRQDGVSSTPFMDWHSGATAVAYDARLIATGGDGTAGGGNLDANAAQFAINGQRAAATPLFVGAINGQTAPIARFDVNGVDVLTIDAAGIVNTAAANEATGAGSAALGANSPAVTNTAPYKWLKFRTGDGSTVYVPAWK